jgi:glutathione synthase/RimK-type ligase-like ATP-grasp enzyme
MDKHYLLELHQKGIPIPKTLIVKNCDVAQLDFGQFLTKNKLTQCVIKPCIGGGSDDVQRFLNNAEVLAQQENLKAIFREKDMMIQEYLPEVATLGELSLMYFNKVFSHAVIKRPRLGDFKNSPYVAGTTLSASPTENVRSVADKIIGSVQSELLYARVDLVERNNGDVLLMELELIDPVMFLDYSVSSVNMFGEAILGKLEAASTQ